MQNLDRMVSRSNVPRCNIEKTNPLRAQTKAQSWNNKEKQRHLNSPVQWTDSFALHSTQTAAAQIFHYGTHSKYKCHKEISNASTPLLLKWSSSGIGASNSQAFIVGFGRSDHRVVSVRDLLRRQPRVLGNDLFRLSRRSIGAFLLL